MRLEQRPRRLSVTRLLAIPAACIATLAIAFAQESVNLDVVHRLRQEALQNSRVMDHLFYLTDANGPRLTNSPGYFKAANWVVGQMKSWGIDARLESWGPFGRSWEFTHFSAHMIEPAPASLIGVPLAWTPGTDGPLIAEAIVAVIANDADLERYRGKLKDKIVFLGTGRELTMRTTPAATRYTDQQLADIAVAPGAGRGGANVPGARAAAAGGRGGPAGPGAGGGQQFTNRLNRFFAEEGVRALARIGGGQSDGGTVFAQSGGSRDARDPLAPPTFALTPEHYNRVLRLLDRGIPVKLEVDIRARFIDDRTDSANVIAEIRGRTKPGEVVMIGAHFDSWHGGTGATDNAAGSAVMIEVMRILKTLNLPMDRTVRMGLWGGEEQGLFGSRAYVTQHFADRTDMKLKPEHARLSAYFNLDNGTGRIRGVYLQGNDRMRPIFEEWFTPFADLGAGTISIRNTGGTDHTNFDAVGLPGFQFIQDPIEYDSRTHHSNMDVYDRLQAADLQQMAAIVASFVYNAATRPELLPRKPLPAAPPATGGRGGNN
jgi:carboxypeptidase Q